MAPKIEIVGAGLAGLALADELLKKGFIVTVFEKRRVGAGSSGIAAGLVHPYLGQSGKRSFFADEAMAYLLSKLQALKEEANVSFFKEIEIQKIFSNKEEKEEFLSKWSSFEDIKDFDATSVMVKGIFIDPSRYLSLWSKSLEKRGATFVFEEKNPEDVSSCIRVFCIGASLAQYPSVCFPSKIRKGQVLIAKKDARVPHSFTTSGYVACDPFSDEMILGSSYERTFQDEMPDEKEAFHWIFPRLASHLPPQNELHFTGCKSGLRITPIQGYLPVFEKKGEDLWVFGGFGSRGLLYHTLFAKKAADSMEKEYSANNLNPFLESVVG